MKILRITSTLVVAFALSFSLSGCGKKEEAKEHGDEHGGHGHHEGHAEGGAQFKEGKGISLSEETSGVLGVETAEVTEAKVERQIPVTLQVYRSTERAGVSSYVKPGFAYASGFVNDESAQLLKTGQAALFTDAKETKDAGATVAHVDLQTEAATRRAEVVVQFPDGSERYQAGRFIQAIIKTGKEETVTLIPKSALLPAAEGNFVYVVNGEYYFRTAVKVGATYDSSLEIIEGIYPGDKVVTKPVETLWLIELRAVKGGGHSH